jgi:hypothetical protein
MTTPPDRAAFIERIMLAKTKEDAAALYGEIWSVLTRQTLRWADGMLAERLAIAEGRVRSPTDGHRHE